MTTDLINNSDNELPRNIHDKLSEVALELSNSNYSAQYKTILFTGIALISFMVYFFLSTEKIVELQDQLKKVTKKGQVPNRTIIIENNKPFDSLMLAYNTLQRSYNSMQLANVPKSIPINLRSDIDGLNKKIDILLEKPANGSPKPESISSKIDSAFYFKVLYNKQLSLNSNYTSQISSLTITNDKLLARNKSLLFLVREKQNLVTYINRICSQKGSSNYKSIIRQLNQLCNEFVKADSVRNSDALMDNY